MGRVKSVTVLWTPSLAGCRVLQFAVRLAMMMEVEIFVVDSFTGWV